MAESSHITQDTIQQKLAALRAQPAPEEKKETAVMPPGAERYFQAAAVLAYYDPRMLAPVPSTDQQPEDPGIRTECLNYLIGFSEMSSDTREYQEKQAKGETPAIQYRILFSLQDDTRREYLKSLIREGAIERAMKANPGTFYQSGDPLQRMLTGYLTAPPGNILHFNPEELSALYKVSEWLAGITGIKAPPPKEEIAIRIEKLEMLTPLRHLTGIYEDGHFISTFRGRKEELSILRRYVGVAPPQGLLEKLERVYRAIANPFLDNQKDPLLIFGIGGIGKSTLLAQFILEHAEAETRDRFPFVYLDFDRPRLNALEPETLLIEAARQLAAQYRDSPTVASAFDTFYKNWSRAYTTRIDEGDSQGIVLRSTSSSLQRELDRNQIQFEFLQLARLLASSEKKPFVIVLDTFEEVQYKGSEYVRSLYDFMLALRQQHSLVRIIVAGRAPAPELNLYRMELTSLDQEAAQGYLLKLGVRNQRQAKEIVARVGANPLTLQLAAQVASNYGLDDLKELASAGGKSANNLSQLQVQGILYRRILEHIHQPELKKLAYPGIVVRRITPEIIMDVLAGPCELSVTTLAGAQALFDHLLREVSLAVQSEPGVIRYRPDVRKAMLQLLQQSEKNDVVPLIHKAAAVFYANRSSLPDRAEGFYHQLCLDVSPRTLDPLWISGMEEYLLSSVDELPPRAQAFLLAKTGRESINLSVWDVADMEDLNRITARQAANLLNSGQAEAALRVLEENNNRVVKVTGVLTLLKVRALNQLLRSEEAKYAAQQALQSYYANEFPSAIILELRKFAQLPAPPSDAAAESIEAAEPENIAESPSEMPPDNDDDNDDYADHGASEEDDDPTRGGSGGGGYIPPDAGQNDSANNHDSAYYAV